MSIENTGNGQHPGIAHATVAAGAVNGTVPGTYESARRVAADRMERILGRASNRLLKRSVPTSLAAVTSGTDWSAWHFVAQSLGWPLETEDDGAAFLSVDGRICFYRRSKTSRWETISSASTLFGARSRGAAPRRNWSTPKVWSRSPAASSLCRPASRVRNRPG